MASGTHGARALGMAETCVCGLTYDRFRSERVGSYSDAYHHIAWTREHTSRSAVLAHWARCKRGDWTAHVEACSELAHAAAEAAAMAEPEGDASFDPSAWDAPAFDEWGGDALPSGECATDPKPHPPPPKPPIPPRERTLTRAPRMPRERRDPARLPSARPRAPSEHTGQPRDAARLPSPHARGPPRVQRTLQRFRQRVLA